MTEQETSRALIATYYSDHIDELRAFVTKGTQSQEVGEDLVQDLFFRLLKGNRPISPITLPCLVYTMARNMITDYWRHRSAVLQHQTYLQDKLLKDEKIGENSVYSVREVEEILEYGMARLTEKQRIVYRMNILEGMKVSEISKQLCENYKSVENRLGIARKEVRRYMKKMMA